MQQILTELNVEKTPQILALNKADITLQQACPTHPPIHISPLTPAPSPLHTPLPTRLDKVKR